MLHKTFIRLVILIIVSFSTLLIFVSAKKCRQQVTAGQAARTVPVSANSDYLFWESLGSVVMTKN